jgi:hypothetical protein
MLKAWISLCHTRCTRILSHLTGPTSYFCRSGGAVASAMRSGAMDAAAAPKDRTEVRFMNTPNRTRNFESRVLLIAPPGV